MITKSQLILIVPQVASSQLGVDSIVAAISYAFDHLIDEHSFTNINRKSAFLASTAVESAYFHTISENLNYSALGLMTTFSKYFETIDVAKQYEHNPQMIANHVYANRMGNGDEASGDGWKYRGRGFLQLTGRANYTRCGTGIGVDLVNLPESLIDVFTAMKSALWFWNINGLNAYADKDDIVSVTRIINGGLNGLADRQRVYAAAKRYLDSTK